VLVAVLAWQAAARLVRSACPVTRPDPTAVVPGWIAADAGAGPGRGWLLYGSPGQWVRLPLDGELTTYYDPQLPPDRREIATKFPWDRVAAGRLRVEGRRLDAPAPPLRALVPDGYGPNGFQATGLVFPTPGCWEVTGTVDEDTLRFVLSVRPPIPIDLATPAG